MPNPEGYRKALRVMKLAEKYGYPVLSFIDTPAAFPGDEAEERGQAQAIAQNIMEMSTLHTPILVVITGEGGSGGALAMGVGDAVLMLQYAIYTVIPPEGCAAILWRDVSRAKEAAEALRLTAWDLTGLGIIDEIIPEPEGGAHQNPDAATAAVRETLGRHLQAVKDVPIDRLLDLRYEKYRRMGRQMESLARGCGDRLARTLKGGLDADGAEIRSGRDPGVAENRQRGGHHGTDRGVAPAEGDDQEGVRPPGGAHLESRSRGASGAGRSARRPGGAGGAGRRDTGRDCRRGRDRPRSPRDHQRADGGHLLPRLLTGCSALRPRGRRGGGGADRVHHRGDEALQRNPERRERPGGARPLRERQPGGVRPAAHAG